MSESAEMLSSFVRFLFNSFTIQVLDRPLYANNCGYLPNIYHFLEKFTTYMDKLERWHDVHIRIGLYNHNL